MSTLKMLAILFLILVAGGVVQAGEPSVDMASLQRAAESLKGAGQGESYQQHYSRGEQLSLAFATLTGEAANPLLGVTVRSAYVYYKTPSEMRGTLAWYYGPEVWGPLLLLLLGMVGKGTVGEAVPALKKPLDAIADLVSKGGAVVSLPMVLALFAESFSVPVGEAVAAIGDFAFPAAMAADGASGSGMMAVVGWTVSLTLGLAVYTVVWLAFNTIEVLILISPFPAVDAGLKSFRLVVIGALAGVRELSPTGGLILSLVLVLCCALIAGWSLRLSVFGLITSWDMLTFRSRRTRIEGCSLTAFSSSGLSSTLPVRSLGTVATGVTGGLSFSWRPWLVLPRREIALDGASSNYAVGLGLLNPYLVEPRVDGDFGVMLRFPPRFQGHEEAVKSALGLSQVMDTSILRGFRALLNFILGRESAAVGSPA